MLTVALREIRTPFLYTVHLSRGAKKPDWFGGEHKSPNGTDGAICEVTMEKGTIRCDGIWVEVGNNCAWLAEFYPKGRHKFATLKQLLQKALSHRGDE
jgi:hypothetical protein